jgi:hypothetical protein
MSAPLSYTSQFGYYGLRVNPTFDQVAATVRNPLRVPLPDRSAKWYALSPFRALILDAEAKYNEFDRSSIDYRQSGAQLPESAARVRPSDAGHDPTFDEIHRQGDVRDAHDAYEAAFDVMNQEHRRQSEEARTQHLAATYGPNRMDPTVDANHEDLEEAGVPHNMPTPRAAAPRSSWRTLPGQMAAAGQPQARQFAPFEVLSMGQPSTLRAGDLTVSQNMTYEQARDFVVQPTWSS